MGAFRVSNLATFGELYRGCDLCVLALWKTDFLSRINFMASVEFTRLVKAFLFFF